MVNEWQAEQLRKLREPFPAEMVQTLPVYVGEYDRNDGGGRFIPPQAHQKCPACGKVHPLPARHLSYIGHALVTQRLNEVDPAWSMRPLATRDTGEPITAGGLWIELTVCGVTKVGYGHADGKHGGDAVKEMIGDAIRNAAMRFGCGLEMWMGDDDEITYPETDETGREPFSPRLGSRSTRAQRNLADAIEVRHALGAYDGNSIADAIYNELGERYYRMNEREVDEALEFIDEAFPLPIRPCEGQEPLFGDDVEVIPV